MTAGIPEKVSAILTASCGRIAGEAGFYSQTDYDSEGVVGYSDLMILAAN